MRQLKGFYKQFCLIPQESKEKHKPTFLFLKSVELEQIGILKVAWYECNI